MAEKRYQVFISSTYVDLVEERKEVIQALLELDCMPSGMELFPAANESQWNLIKQVIDECDYYVLIIGGRYGSISEPDGISYTEKEYDYAVTIGKPTIAFLHKSPGKIASEKTESKDKGKELLAAFRKKVEQKLCKHWDSAAELGSVVSRSLVQLMRSTPAVGWVRANELANEEATKEILELRKQVDSLTKQLETSKTTAPKGVEDLAQGDDEHTFEVAFLSKKKVGGSISEWFWIDVKATWNELFAYVAPTMIHETTEEAFEIAVNNFFYNFASDQAAKQAEELLLSGPEKIELDDGEIQTVKVQLLALGLIKKSEKQRSVKDKDGYLELTPFGYQTMTRLRAVKKKTPRVHGL